MFITKGHMNLATVYGPGIRNFKNLYLSLICMAIK